MKRSLLTGMVLGLLLLSPSAFAQIFFTASLDSAQEVPAPTGAVPGKGTGSFTLNDARTELSYRVTVTGLSGNIAAGHFHNGPAGTAAGVVRTLTFVGNTASGVWKNTDSQALTDSLVRELLKGRLYINVHTAVNPGGEIRGQVLLTTGIGFTAALDSTQEVPAPTGAVPGKGTGSFTLNAARTELTYNVTVNGLSGNIAAGHFHNGPAGTAAGVVRTLTFAGNTASGVWKNTDSQALTDSMVSELLKGRIYVNVHTAVNPGGEIRGQLGIGPGTVTSVEQTSRAIPASFTLGQNYPNPFNPTTAIQFQVQRIARVTLKVYDVLGQEVATLLDDVRPAGTYTATFNASSFASGVYFYRLSSDGGFRESRKMLLLK